MNKWSRPFEGSSAPAAPAGGSFAPVQHHYFAFLSYSHDDAAMADWLHGELERFRVPASLAGRLTGNGVVPERLSPIFRDRHELAAGHDLTAEIRQALAGSRCLIVLCSPAAARSKWTNAEIEEFKRAHPEGCVIAAIAAGEPFASEGPGDAKEECFPAALRQKYDRRGRSTGRRAEPLAADLRESGDGRRLGLLKIVAGILGLGLDDLVQRDHLRRQRRLAAITAGSLGGMLIASFLAVTAINARDEARDQRREAEGLVAFMLGDLKEKLEPIGKLDALDGVGTKVLDYYRKQDAAELSDSGLMQRSRALSLMAGVAYARGDLGSAERLYSEALDGTAEAVRRDPVDAQRLFDHAQNVFWKADIARQQGRLANAEAGMREYKRLADAMVGLDHDNMQWRMEQQSADFNVGVMLFERRDFEGAILQFKRALGTIEALATADPANSDYQIVVTEAQTWLADALASSGRLGEALALRTDLTAKLQNLLGRTGNVVYRQKLVPDERYLGQLHLLLGQPDRALADFSAAVDHADQLRSREPENLLWQYLGARARLDRASAQLVAGNLAAAAGDTAAACDTTAHLLATDSTIQTWRGNLRDCWQLRARRALVAGDLRLASEAASRSLIAAKSIRSTDPVEDKYAVAMSYRLLGDAHARRGERVAARSSWQAGLAMLPADVAEKPMEMAERARILQRLGRSADSSKLSGKLGAMGYKSVGKDS